MSHPDLTRPWQGQAEPVASAGDARYRWLHLLACGGMGEVWRVRDTRLQRDVVLKVQHTGTDTQLFLHEARVVGRLAHPALVPVLDLGELPDGRWFFTMPEVHGVPFDPRGPLRAGVVVVHRVAQALAVAHDQGVVHRDLKPDNILIGALGQVHLVDWGLAANVGLPVPRSGTPRWSAPEQSTTCLVSTTMDVYALGLLLRTVLTGLEPWKGHPDPWQPLSQGEVPTPPEEGPSALLDLCAACTQANPSHRPSHASEVVRALQRWLDGEDRRARAQELVEEADTVRIELERTAADASALRRRAQSLLATVKPWDGVDHKEGAWALQDQAAALEAQVENRSAEQIGMLQAALVQDPDAVQARARLADLHRDALLHAERHGRDASLHEILLRQHDPGRHRDWLASGGVVSLRTDIPGVMATAWPVETVTRRRILGAPISLGTTPLVEVALPAGSWVIELSHPGCERVLYPVVIGRREHWDGVSPEGEAVPIWMPPTGSLRDEAYVPAGWTTVGGDEHAPDPRDRKRVWVDGFLIARDAVTNAQYQAWLTRRLRAGLPVDDVIPRTRDGHGTRGAPIFEQVGERFLLPDGITTGDALLGDAPVILVDVASAEAYATADARRLPTGFEWEKAARGVDARAFPWGDFLDPSFCCMLRSHPGRPSPARITDFQVDTSVYGVRGLAGNVRDWCNNLWVRDDSDARCGARVAPQHGAGVREIRGGSWLSSERLVRAALRSGASPVARKETVGFRLARDLPTVRG